VVIQKSADGGKTWSRIMPVSPGYPRRGGSVAAPLIVEPSGRVDVLFWVLAGAGHTLLPAGHVYFTASDDRGSSWSTATPVGAGAGTISPRVTWIDAALSIDVAGTLYATWEHIMAVAGGGAKLAYLAWLSDNAAGGYTLSVRPFSLEAGWLSAPVRVSGHFGNPRVWPGYTIGISALPGGNGRAGTGKPGSGSLVVSGGSAIGCQTSQIWAALVEIGR
jgi:hypothetical protein